MRRLTLPTDAELSRRLARRVAAENKECWRNAFRAMSQPAARESGALYVEGWVVPEAFPIVADHAWLVIPDTAIVDPTPTYHEDTARTYFAARTFTFEEMARAALKHGIQPFTTEGDQFTGLRFTEWRHTYLEAQVWAWGRKATRQLYGARLTEEDRDIITAASVRPEPNTEETP